MQTLSSQLDIPKATLAVQFRRSVANILSPRPVLPSGEKRLEVEPMGLLVEALDFEPKIEVHRTLSPSLP